MTRLLTKKQAAELLNCSLSKIEKMMRHGELPFLKIGALVRFREEDIESTVVKNVGGTGSFLPLSGLSGKSGPLVETTTYVPGRNGKGRLG
jgi:excisionase family DNA binding protein